jgi:hypothetical protein
LHTWQAAKLYFFSDTANISALDGKGPQYPWSEVSPSRNVSYGRLALESIANHRTQDYPGLLAEAALKNNDFGPLKDMKTRLVLGKSLVQTSTTADVFEGITADPLAFHRIRGYEPESSTVSAELGGPWAFYKQFWRAHDLVSVEHIFPPQMKAAISSAAVVPLLLHNNSAAPATFDVTVVAPNGWPTAKGAGHYPLRPHESRTVAITIPTPAQMGPSQPVHIIANGAELSIEITLTAKD